MNCVFCKIIVGKLPAEILYQDELILCFLDIAPINPGHALIVPTKHHTSITTVPHSILSRMMCMAPQIGQTIVRVVKGDGFNLHLANGQCAGQDVLHTHLHIIPRSPTDGFSWGWRVKGYASEDQKREIVQKVLDRLKPKMFL